MSRVRSTICSALFVLALVFAVLSAAEIRVHGLWMRLVHAARSRRMQVAQMPDR